MVRGGVGVVLHPLSPLEFFFQNKCDFYKGLMSKKGNFQLLHADLAVFNSNRFFLVFLKNLYFQQL